MSNLMYCWKILYNNQAVIDGRKKKWWITAILFVLGIFLTWIPLMSKGYTADNASFMTSSSNQEVDRGFEAAFVTDYFRTINFTTDSNGKPSLDMTKISAYAATDAGALENEANGTNTSNELAAGSYTDTSVSTDTTVLTNPTGITTTFYFDSYSVLKSSMITSTLSSSSSSSSTSYEDSDRVTLLNMYYFPAISLKGTTNGSQFRNNFINKQILKTNTTSSSVTAYPHSYALIFQDEIDIVLYSTLSSKSNSATASYVGDLQYAVSTEVAASNTTLYNSIFAKADGTTNSVTEAYKAFHDMLHKAATPSALNTVWINCGIMSAAVVIMELVGALALFIMQRRKNSVCRDTNFWEAMKEAVAMAFTPEIIGLAIGFLSFTNELVLLIGAYVLRVVWISSKISPPVSASGDSNKPLYQARS
ncbi:MAG: hypothetical protein WCR56_06465 [Bacilli bacterium]